MILNTSIIPMQFLPTPSARRATLKVLDTLRDKIISTHALREEGDDVHSLGLFGGVGISTHALREEGDTVCLSGPMHASDFYPRPPRGGRPWSILL